MFPFPAPAIVRAATATILKPQDYFAILAQPANAMQAAINALPFSPGLLIGKGRGASGDWAYRDSLRGPGFTLASNTPAAEAAWSGYSGSNNRIEYVSKIGAKYLAVGTFTHVNGTPKSIDLSSLDIVGDAAVKRRDAEGDWYVWHRSLTAGNNLRLNATAGQSATDAFISVSGTTLTFSASAPSGDYTYEAYAHDPSADGIVQCGSGTTDAGGNSYVALPWYAQAVVLKGISQSSNWLVADTTRGANFSSAAILRLNTPGVETLESDLLNIPQSGNKGFYLQDTGAFLPGGASFVYRAIRAPY